MRPVLVFAVVLFGAVLVSGLAKRSVLSTAVLFLVAGFLVGEGTSGLLGVAPGDEPIGAFAELALFAVLFTDGMRLGFGELREAWRLPGRALLLGLPLTLVVTALLGHWLTGLGWRDAFLLGAALSPTDPVLAAAIIGREQIPGRLRHLLNVESGLNDGLALPIVVVLIATAGSGGAGLGEALLQAVAGVALGVALPAAMIRLEQTRCFHAVDRYEALGAFSIGLVLLGVASLTHANEFLAAFAGGITVATVGPAAKEAFEKLGESVAELLKLAALLLFGALISPSFLGEVSPSGYVFVALALLVARPAALLVALAWSELSRGERLAAAWFGPKGFASVVYGLLILESDVAAGDELFHLIALVVVASVVAHSSTDVLVARRFERSRQAA
jgi:NhaP-type Na+/H+ or K+/H+ antiporter